jgi:hypothetical protein
VRGEIEEAERMEEFHAESRRFEAGTREEVQRLRDSVSQVWSRYFASIY